MVSDGSRPEPAASAHGDPLGLRPLTARSVILSVLLGTHPPLLPVRSLVRTTELFGITEGTARVALSRLVADHEVVADGSRYRLSDRLVARQGRLDEGRAPATRPWRGSWEMAVAAPTTADAAGRDGSGSATTGRAALAAELAALRLSELRSGVWARPANLRRGWPSSLRDRVWRFEVRTIDSSGGWRPAEPKELAADLWDLEGWASRADALLDAFGADDQPARRFMVAAAIVRHLQTDPLLPRSLLPSAWPGAQLRGAYTSYERELGDLLRRERRLHG